MVTSFLDAPKKKRVQYWKNGVLIGLVTPEEAEEIIKNARGAGYKVNTKYMPMYFTVETE